MAEDEKPAAPGPSRASLFRRIGIAAGVVLAAALLGFLTFWFAIMPMLGPADAQDVPEGEQPIPAGTVTVSFEEGYVNVIMPDPEIPASHLLFKVSLECANATTASLVEAHKPRFTDMINSEHSFRTREELNDRLVREGIQKQILERANQILRRLQSRPDPAVRVTAVFHEKWAVADQ